MAASGQSPSTVCTAKTITNLLFSARICLFFPQEKWEVTSNTKDIIYKDIKLLCKFKSYTVTLFAAFTAVLCSQSPVQCAHSVSGAETRDPVLPPALTVQQVYLINQPRPGAGQALCRTICLPQHPQGGWRAASNGVTSAGVMLVLDQHRQLIIALLPSLPFLSASSFSPPVSSFICLDLTDYLSLCFAVWLLLYRKYFCLRWDMRTFYWSLWGHWVKQWQK